MPSWYTCLGRPVKEAPVCGLPVGRWRIGGFCRGVTGFGIAGDRLRVKFVSLLDFPLSTGGQYGTAPDDAGRGSGRITSTAREYKPVDHWQAHINTLFYRLRATSSAASIKHLRRPTIGWPMRWPPTISSKSRSGTEPPVSQRRPASRATVRRLTCRSGDDSDGHGMGA